jgi:hypothetical protein
MGSIQKVAYKNFTMKPCQENIKGQGKQGCSFVKESKKSQRFRALALVTYSILLNHLI